MQTIKTISRLFSAAALAVCAAFTASCSDEDTGYHSTYFYPLNGGNKEVFADQTTDSVTVYSYDTWTASVNSDWLNVTLGGKSAPFTVEVPDGYVSRSVLTLVMQPNTTGKVRSTAISAASSSTKIGTVMQGVVQYPFLKITNPSVSRVTTTGGTTEYTFAMTGIAKDGYYHTFDVQGKETKTQPSVSFTVFADGATLTSAVDWITIVPQTDSEGKTVEGYAKNTVQTVKLNVAANETGQARTGSVVLTSNGVSTSISVSQNS